MSNDLSAEDRAILAALEVLESGTEPQTSARAERGRPLLLQASGEDRKALSRPYLELFGLLACGLDPETPPSSARERLLAELSRPAPLGFPVPLPERSRRQPAAAPRWQLGLAAGLLLCLAGTSAWLYQGRLQQDRTIAGLRRQLETERLGGGSSLAERDRLARQLVEMQGRLALVSSPGTIVSNLLPEGDRPVQPGARGVLLVAADHQHWFLALSGLGPAGPGRCYRLWWESDGGMRHAGTFDAVSGRPIEMSSAVMPPGTRGAMVTLELEAGDSRGPRGAPVLHAGAFKEL